ncbi:hypothetical protein [Paraburkholderia bannensis]|uniref:hypothetical protein n=1 Tax=Paraburkholderia bannensis TaxID=765414 RepID=UPI002ABD967C|nr:hypothetical protein [Paraburkholderia bannensis]
MKLITALIAAALTVPAAAAFAAQPDHFPNLVHAQQLIDQSNGLIETARRDNHDDFGGHATRAEELLRQAKAELDQAARYREHH